MKTSSVEGRDINLEFGRVGFQTRQDSPLLRTGRGSHPVLGSGLKTTRGTARESRDWSQTSFSSFAAEFIRS